MIRTSIGPLVFSQASKFLMVRNGAWQDKPAFFLCSKFPSEANVCDTFWRTLSENKEECRKLMEEKYREIDKGTINAILH